MVREAYGKLQVMADPNTDLRAHLLAYCDANPGVAHYVLTDLLNHIANEPLRQIENSLVMQLLHANLELTPESKVQKMFGRMMATMVNPATGSSFGTALPYCALPYCEAALHVRVSESGPSHAFEELSYFIGDNNHPDYGNDLNMPSSDLPAHITCPKEQYDFWNPTTGSKHWETQWIPSMLLVYVYVYCAFIWLELTCHSLICR